MANERKNLNSVTKAVAEQNAVDATKDAVTATTVPAPAPAEKKARKGNGAIVESAPRAEETKVEPKAETKVETKVEPKAEPKAQIWLEKIDKARADELMALVNNKGKKPQDEHAEDETEAETAEDETEAETAEDETEAETAEDETEAETAEDETEDETEEEETEEEEVSGGGKPPKKSSGIRKFFAGFLTAFVLFMLIALGCKGCNSQWNSGGTTAGTTEGTTAGTTAGTTEGTTAGTTAGTTSGTTEGTTSGTTPVNPEPDEVFDLEAFKQQVVNLAIASGLEEGEAYKRVTVLVNTFGTEPIEKWVKENGSYQEAEFMSTLLTHGVKALADQLAEAQGLKYAMTQNEFFTELLQKSAEFEATHGADPEDLLDEYAKNAPHGGARPEEILDVAKEKLEGESLKAFSEWYTFRNKGFADATQYERCQAEAEDMLLSSTENIKFYELVREQVDGGFADINGNPTNEFLEAVRQYSRRLKAGYAA
jgi:hypothetical protein